MAVNEVLAQAMLDRADGGQLPCAAAFAIAEALGVPVGEVGAAANELGIKIVDCQLGCFGRWKKKRD